MLKKGRTRKNTKGKIIFIILVVLLTSLFISSNQNKLRIASTEIARNSLQLETFYPSTTPKPPIESPTRPAITIVQPTIPIPNIGNHGTCIPEGPIVECSCEGAARQDVYCNDDTPLSGGQSACPDIPGNPVDCNKFLEEHPNCQRFCVSKPVVYLYPEEPALVNVRVVTTGEIVVSDPLYPPGGWKNVLAHPSGKLEYQGKSYRELFFETSVTDFRKPTAGITLEINNIESQLDSIITKLGLTREDERQEFLEWWVPRLKALNSKYIFFSIIDYDEKQKLDHLEISPKPDTLIEFIAYFKPINKPFQGKTLILPLTPQKRIGFTAVEWGGVIDNGIIH